MCDSNEELVLQFHVSQCAPKTRQIALISNIGSIGSWPTSSLFDL